MKAEYYKLHLKVTVKCCCTSENITNQVLCCYIKRAGTKWQSHTWTLYSNLKSREQGPNLIKKKKNYNIKIEWRTIEQTNIIW